MDRAKFYASLRLKNSGVFGTSLGSKQVQGVEAILDECLRQGADLGQAAYILATAYGETGGKMQPRYENMNYSAGRIPQVFSRSRRQGVPVTRLAHNPKLLANTVYGGEYGLEKLGNTNPGDGWRFRGTGIPQCTGRRNFTKWGDKLGLNLIDNPQFMMTLGVSVAALVRGMLEGWATGLKLARFVSGPRHDYYNARRVWNGTFEAEKYAGYAVAFQRALQAGRYQVGGSVAAPAQPRPQKAPPVKTVAPKRKMTFAERWWQRLTGKAK